MKHNGFLLLHATSKVQNMVAVASYIQNLEANLHKHQTTKPKAQPITLGAKLRRKHKHKV